VSAEYRSFLLRLQRSQPHEHWRATLQNAQSGETLRFATEREMLAYLLQLLTPRSTDADQPPQINERHE
jgi:hypothetical protein